MTDPVDIAIENPENHSSVLAIKQYIAMEYTFS